MRRFWMPLMILAFSFVVAGCDGDGGDGSGAADVPTGGGDDVIVAADAGADLVTTPDVPVGEDVPQGGDVAALEDVPVAEDVPQGGDVTAIEDVPVAEDIPQAEDVPVGGDVAAIEDVPVAEDIPAPPADVCEPECPSGERRCDGTGAFVVCEDDPNGCHRWGVPEACGGGEVCDDGWCVTPCDPEDTRCLDTFTLQVCEDGQIREEGCLFGCDAVAGACYPCPAGAWRCEDTGEGDFRLMSCDVTGAWNVVDYCQECECQAGGQITMACRYSRADVPTTCTECSDDGLLCLP